MNNKRNGSKKITVKKFYKKFYSKRNSTKTNQLIASRNTFRPICTKTLDLKEDDAHIINLQINNIATQNPERDLLHHHKMNATTFIVPGKTDLKRHETDLITS